MQRHQGRHGPQLRVAVAFLLGALTVVALHQSIRTKLVWWVMLLWIIWISLVFLLWILHPEDDPAPSEK